MAARLTQCGDHEQPIAVLLQPPVAYFGEAEDALDDPEGMFDLRTHLRLGTALLALPLGQRLVTAGPMRHSAGMPLAIGI